MFKKICDFIKEKQRQAAERRQDYEVLKIAFYKLEFSEREELTHLSHAIGNKHMLRLKIEDKNTFLKFQKNIPTFSKYCYVASTFEGGFVVELKNPLYQILKDIRDNGQHSALK
ncbi:MAG: hypothetical protein WCS83_04180 [Endomicrobiia bacterium]